MPALWVASVWLWVLVGACGKPRNLAPGPTRPYDFRLEGEFPAPIAVEPVPARGDRWSGGTELLALPPETPDGSDSAKAATPGYRVQVFAGKSQQLADSVRAEIATLLLEKAYVIHVEPHYKVLVGDCDTRAECEQLRLHLRQAGYVNAWIVQSRIAP